MACRGCRGTCWGAPAKPSRPRRPWRPTAPSCGPPSGQDDPTAAGRLAGRTIPWPGACGQANLLLGVKAVIAESYERTHRSNPVGMGVLPLQVLSAVGVSKRAAHRPGSEEQAHDARGVLLDDDRVAAAIEREPLRVGQPPEHAAWRGR